MLCRRGHQLQPADGGALPPVQLLHLGRRHAPADEPVAHAQRRDEVLRLGRKLLDGCVVQVVVVVVRQDHAGNGRQLVNRDGRRMKTLGAQELERRGALGKHRVGQPELAVDLKEQGGVPQAPQAQVGRGQQV